MEKIAIYWGAFNPPTLWHKEVIIQTLSRQHVDKIIFAPDGKRKDKNFGISTKKRQEVIEIFAWEMEWSWFNVEFDDYFLKKDGNTATIEVDRYYQEKLGVVPYHIFGIDTITSMPTRIGNEHGYIQNGLRKIFVQRKWFQIPKNLNMQNYIILDLDILEISSTTVREMIKNKLKVDHILTPKVHEFISNEELYKTT